MAKTQTPNYQVGSVISPPLKSLSIASNTAKNRRTGILTKTVLAAIAIGIIGYVSLAKIQHHKISKIEQKTECIEKNTLMTRSITNANLTLTLENIADKPVAEQAADVTTAVRTLHYNLIARDGIGAFYGCNSTYKPEEGHKGRAPEKTSCIGYPLYVLDKVLKNDHSYQLARRKALKQSKKIAKDIAEFKNRKGDVKRGDKGWIDPKTAYNAAGMTATPLMKYLCSEMGWVGIGFVPKQLKEKTMNFLKKRGKQGQYGSYGVPIVQFQDKTETGCWSYEFEEQLRNIPFAVGTSGGGGHTWILSYGNVYEVHWKQGPSSTMLFDKTPFEYFAQNCHGAIVFPKEYLRR